MYAIVKILEMLARQQTKLHRLIREMPPSIIVKEKVTCPFENKGTVMRRLSEDVEGLSTMAIDGIKINFERTGLWPIRVRISPTFTSLPRPLPSARQCRS